MHGKLAESHAGLYHQALEFGEFRPRFRPTLCVPFQVIVQRFSNYVQEAVKAKKWAFAADYIRMYALYKEGGIYLDSDVKVLKSFDPFLHHRFFSSMEYHPSQIERLGTMQHIDKEGKRIDDTYISGIQIQAAVMGAEPGSKFVGEVLEWYDRHRFISQDGELNVDIIAPFIYSRIEAIQKSP